jgi:hypothetical protein
MPLSLLFWMVYVLSIFFVIWAHYPFVPTNYRPFGAIIVAFILIGFLGWHDFGAAIQRN